MRKKELVKEKRDTRISATKYRAKERLEREKTRVEKESKNKSLNNILLCKIRIPTSISHWPYIKRDARNRKP